MGRRDSFQRQETRTRSVDQIGYHGGPRRIDGRNQSGNARPKFVGRGYPDHWSISATEQETHADRKILHHGRVRGTARVWLFDRLQMSGVEPAGAVVVSRRGAGESIECGAQEVVWRCNKFVRTPRVILLLQDGQTF